MKITNNKKCLYNHKKSHCVLTFKMEKKNTWFLNNGLNNKIRLFINFILFKHTNH